MPSSSAISQATIGTSPLLHRSSAVRAAVVGRTVLALRLPRGEVRSLHPSSSSAISASTTAMARPKASVMAMDADITLAVPTIGATATNTS